MKKLIIILVIILVCILIVGGVLIVMGTMNEKPQQETTMADATTAETSLETEAVIPETEETEPTETVVVTTAKETEPETTAETTTAEKINPTEPTEGENILPNVDRKHADGTVTGSGSFASSTGASLDVQVDWQTFKTSGGDRKVCLDIYLKCINLYVGSRSNGITITLGDTTKTLDTDEIDYTGSSTSILIGSVIMDLPEGSTDCSVSWAYRGSYNQIKIDNITATGSIG